MIELAGVSCWYGSVVALSEVAVQIGPGVTGLLGPNGAGKTTLIRLASGQLKPRLGSVTMDGMRPWGNRRILSRLGYAPEGDVFYWQLTGRAFVESLLGLTGHSSADAARLAGAAIERVGLTDAADRAVITYSKGMKQRLKFAQAIAHDPDYILLDEPFEGTDPVARRQLMDLVAELGAAGKVVVLSSHVLHEVEQLTQQIVMIAQGKVLATGRILEIRSLLDRYPTQLMIEGSDLRQLGCRMLELPYVESVELAADDSRMFVRTGDPNACYDEIGRIAVERGGIDRLTCTDEDLASVFAYLTTSS